jgi:hypothetical protein
MLSIQQEISMKIHHILAALVAASATLVSAQTLTGIKTEPAQVKVGESVKLTANLDSKDGMINCGLKFSWGDGTNTYEDLTSARDIPRIGSHSYAKPGTYTISVVPTKAGSSLKCSGKEQQSTVVVSAPAPAPVAAAPAAPAPVAAAPAKAAAASVCPAGWNLTKAGVNKKTKAFTCTAKANTALPEAKVSCPGDLTYFENAKKGQLGCRV